MFQRFKKCILIFSLLTLVGQSYASAFMGAFMANHSVDYTLLSEFYVASETGSKNVSEVNDHCADRAQREIPSHSSISDPEESFVAVSDSNVQDNCCAETCQCVLGVCSTSLFDNSVSVRSLDSSSQPLFSDIQFPIVRLATSLYRPPIAA